MSLDLKGHRMENDECSAAVRHWERYGRHRRFLPKPLWTNIAEYTAVAYDRQVERILATTFHRGQIVLDIGCGDGRWTEYLLSLGVTGVGVDLLRASTVATAGRTCRMAGRSLAVVADAVHLPFKTVVFDGIISFGLLEHFAEHEQVVGHWKSLVARGGTAVISVPNARRKDWMAYSVLHELVVHRRLLWPRTAARGIVSRSYGYEERWTGAYFAELCRRVGFRQVQIQGLFTLVPLLFHPVGDRIPRALFRLLASPRPSREWGLYLFATAKV
ncbi:MAG: class I SAM-dependent methyltransferase [candidate division KSB1 bacterium]|nr:class I SAM-dependent methyltransferase [candidate division KSB1 bacterium]